MNQRIPLADLQPRHFGWSVADRVATVTLNRPERKNPLTFDSYRELADTFHRLRHVEEVKAVVLTGAGENFCSGGDVHEIIGPLVRMRDEKRMDHLLEFTRLTGELVKTMRACPQPIVAAIDGICAGAGAILAMASDLRLGSPRSRVAFLFVRVGLSGADMGACAILPRIVGQGRASELLYTGRFMEAAEAERWGFYNRLVAPESLLAEAVELALRHLAGQHLQRECGNGQYRWTIQRASQRLAELLARAVPDAIIGRKEADPARHHAHSKSSPTSAADAPCVSAPTET